jgi:hypothetical protein
MNRVQVAWLSRFSSISPVLPGRVLHNTEKRVACDVTIARETAFVCDETLSGGWRDVTGMNQRSNPNWSAARKKIAFKRRKRKFESEWNGLV